MHDWRSALGFVVVVVLLALVVMILTARNRSYVATNRMRNRRRFRPDWDRDHSDDPSKRRGIHIRR